MTQSGHWFLALHIVTRRGPKPGRNLATQRTPIPNPAQSAMLPAGYGQADAIRSIETAAVHRGDWRLGVVADDRSGAAVAADRRAHVVGRKRSPYKDLPFRFHAGACGIGLDRWRQRADGGSLGRRQR